MTSVRDPISAALAEAEPRPATDGTRSEKKNYAERFSRAIATEFANALRNDFPGITPNADGTAQETPARSARGLKKLDVNYSTPDLGLGLGVSVKTINFRDPRTKRYTKNYSRNDNELRAEAKDYHQRQPYAVLIAIIMIPLDSIDDGSKHAPSSFGAAVKYFRHRSQRVGPHDEHELFERVFIGLHDHEDPLHSCAGFFDAQLAPPRTGCPYSLLTFEQVIGAIIETYDQRNDPPFEWAD